MLSLSESGTLPNATALSTYNIGWDYYSMWQDGYLSNYNAQQVQALLNSDRIITLNELPSLPWSNTAVIPGDFNHDGKVDMADYVVWRNMQNQSGSNLAADADLNGRVDAADYAVWRLHFGQTSGSGAGAAAVPEPASLVLVLLAISYSISRRSKRACVAHY
jgi:hypothetical protein